MQTFHCCTIAFSLMSFSVLAPGLAFAGAKDSHPLLSKVSRSGFVPVEYVKEETCEVFADHITVTRVMGGKTQIKTVETKTHQMTGDVQSVIMGASKGQVTTEPALTIDGPTYIYTGYMMMRDKLEEVTLKSENGMNGSMTFNPTNEANLLISVLDSVCPRAY